MSSAVFCLLSFQHFFGEQGTLRSEILIFFLGVEAGAGLVDVRQVAVSHDAGIGVCDLQLFQQFQQGTFLLRGAGVGRLAVRVEATLVADT